MKKVVSFYLSPDVIAYLEFTAKNLKMSKTAVLEMIVRYISTYDVTFERMNKPDEDTETNIDDIIQYDSLFKEDVE